MLLAWGILLTGGAGGLASWLVIDNASAGPKYTPQLLGQAVPMTPRLSPLAVFCSGIALGVIFCIGIWLIATAGRRHLHRAAERRPTPAALPARSAERLAPPPALPSRSTTSLPPAAAAAAPRQLRGATSSRRDRGPAPTVTLRGHDRHERHERRDAHGGHERHEPRDAHGGRERNERRERERRGRNDPRERNEPREHHDERVAR